MSDGSPGGITSRLEYHPRGIMCRLWYKEVSRAAAAG
jgi:hypothetical protein